MAAPLSPSKPSVSKSSLSASLWLILGTLGVVYGDIGTSPLYAVNQLFIGGQNSVGHLAVTVPIVLGSISLIFWALTIVVSLKYLAFVLLADREGQGGVFALLGILEEHKKKIAIGVLVLILLLSAGFLFGEGVITPAISVLAAAEGLSLITPAFVPYITLITVIVLTLLFMFQYKGAARIGSVFGPVMILWFVAIAALGLRQIISHPEILEAINPLYGLGLLTVLSARDIFLLFSGVVLSVAGVEALYADLGHFGRSPIRLSWLCFVYPALLLNYAGQGAYLLDRISAASVTGIHGLVASAGVPVITTSIFYSIVPHVLLYPMIILATLAAIVASQALISGAYSLVAQAVALNYLPRFKIIHTNKSQEGQIYVPAVNWLLYIGAVILVLAFGSSGALAGAYGFAISAVMFTTTLAMLAVSLLWWRWQWWHAVLLFGFFAVIDGIFVISNGIKFVAGGWVPVAMGFALFVLMISWNWGRRMVYQALDHYANTGADVGADAALGAPGADDSEDKHTIATLTALKKRISTAGGTITDARGRFVEAERAVIFLTYVPVASIDDPLPIIVRAYMRRTGAIPKHVILLYIDKTRLPYVRKNRYLVKAFGSNVFGVVARFGFMEDINLHAIVAAITNDVPVLKSDRYLVEAGAEEIHPAARLPLTVRLRLRFFRLLQRLATPTYRYFGIESSTSLSTTTFHIYVDDHGSTVRLPNVDLVYK